MTRRSATPLVLWLWNVLRHRSAADRWHVLTAALASVNSDRHGDAGTDVWQVGVLGYHH
ncbi:MAG: hypothetical protein M3389_16255 [Actinomycetota bacterium]|nr:hypothetical protein [Actinomycetota bacterium]